MSVLNLTAIKKPVATKFANPLANRPVIASPLPFHLAFKEVWCNKSRFMLIAGVVALITLLVLFTAGLAEGLGLGNREFIEKANADLIVYSDKSELLIPGSRISEGRIRDLRQIDGVQAVGAIAWTNVAIVFPDTEKAALKVALGGVLAGQPGEPVVTQGAQLGFRRGMEAIIDKSTAMRSGLMVGDKLVIRSLVGSKEKRYDLVVSGITESNQYSLQPTVFVPHQTYDQIRPRVSDSVSTGVIAPPVTFNIAFVQLNNAADKAAMATYIEQDIADSKSIVREADGVRVVDKKTAYENTPGYSAQQSTLGLQSVFTLLIGVLVVGGFFRIQALQKIAQIGVLKAIGTSNFNIAVASLTQIFVVNAFGVLLGSALTLLLTLGIPATVPVRFDGSTVIFTVALLLVIGPIGGFEAVRVLLKVEPLKALGLAS